MALEYNSNLISVGGQSASGKISDFVNGSNFREVWTHVEPVKTLSLIYPKTKSPAEKSKLERVVVDHLSGKQEVIEAYQIHTLIYIEETDVDIKTMLINEATQKPRRVIIQVDNRIFGLIRGSRGTKPLWTFFAGNPRVAAFAKRALDMGVIK